MEQTNIRSSSVKISLVGEEERASFIKKTYAHVAIAVLAFMVIETLLIKSGFGYHFMNLIQGNMIMMILVFVGFGFASSFAHKWSMSAVSKQEQYTGLFLFVVLEAVIFSPILSFASDTERFPQFEGVITQAAFITLALFAGLTLIVLTTKKDFSFMASILKIGFMIALGLIVVGWIFGFSLGLWFSVGIVLLAAGSILYQTSNMIHHYNTDQHVAAALGLFSSLMLMFMYILRILMSSRD